MSAVVPSAATGALSGAPYVATKRIRGAPKWTRWCHASAVSGAFGRAPHGATKRVRCAEMGAMVPCERSH
eukprot:1093707-Pyramimonas_sp.AAC.1